MSTNIDVPDGVSFITVSGSVFGSQKNIVLPYISSSLNTDNRILYLKEATGNVTNYFQIYPNSSNGVYNGVGGLSSMTINTLGCIQLQANQFNWDVLDTYAGQVGISNTTVPGGVTTVIASANTSYINVDLTSQSKKVVLPAPYEVSNDSNLSMFYTIKDINGYASTNNLYVTSATGVTIDNASNIVLSTNYASVQLLAEPSQSKWLITGYYSGS